MKNLVLASGSPRRRDILNKLGVHFSISSPDIDEQPLVDEQPADYVDRLAVAKAIAVRQKGQWAIGSDTVGYLNNTFLQKPVDKADALAMLSSMSGCWHDIYTSVAIVGDSYQQVNHVHSRVKFRALSLAEIEYYWSTGEPQDKAGAYGIQGLGAALVERIEGDYSAIVGLPIALTLLMLREIGIDPWSTHE